MNNGEMLKNMIQENLDEMGDTIDCLYTTSNACVKNRLLNRLRKHMSNLSMLVQGLQQSELTNSSQPGTGKVFTREALAGYNGKNGSPAYVAVNGVVYDVTRNAAWGGATHFGLAAGTDVTGQFAACHAGQPILSKLKVVGTMTE